MPSAVLTTGPPGKSLSFFFFFDSIHFNGCEVVSHCGFDLHFPTMSDVEHLIIFGEMSVQVDFHYFALSHLYCFRQVN